MQSEAQPALEFRKRGQVTNQIPGKNSAASPDKGNANHRELQTIQRRCANKRQNIDASRFETKCFPI